MCSSSTSFKWLDILEKEFDKAFVNIDLLLTEFDGDDTDILHLVRKKLGTMCSCFSQLSHKALTIFQVNCKAEAEIVYLRSEIVDIKVQNELLEKEMHSLLVQLHTNQLERLNLVYPEQKENIKDKLQRDLAENSPIRTSFHDLEKKILTLEHWKTRLQTENELLRTTIATLQAEVCGARLAARYLDKELAGRIQQLQLLTREDMNYDIRTKLWDQLDAEILLQRHKTVIKVMRQQKNHNTPPDDIAGRVRSVYLHRDPSKGLGISVTGGKEHGVPILISDLEPELSKKNLFVGDAILSVNGIDLNQLTHKEAVQVLSSQIGNVILTVITLSTVNVDEIEEETNIPSYLSYPFFEESELESANITFNNKILNTTPTAPRTPPSRSTGSEKSSPEKHAEPIKLEETRSDNELFGITTLQNIFRNVSSIESGQKLAEENKSEKAAEESKSQKPAEEKSKSPKKENQQPPNFGIAETSRRRCSVNLRSDLNGTYSIDSIKPISAVLNTNMPSDKSIHSTSVISGIGDANVGTPV